MIKDWRTWIWANDVCFSKKKTFLFLIIFCGSKHSIVVLASSKMMIRFWNMNNWDTFWRSPFTGAIKYHQPFEKSHLILIRFTFFDFHIQFSNHSPTFWDFFGAKIGPRIPFHCQILNLTSHSVFIFFFVKLFFYFFIFSFFKSYFLYRSVVGSY